MNVSVFGLGYVGVVTAACLAREGHMVIGVDIDESKVGLVNDGLSPIIEEDIGGFVEKAQSSGNLRATTSSIDAVEATDMAIVCVGTPSLPDGSLNQSFLETVTQEIGAALANRPVDSSFLVVVRSTMVPGTMRNIIMPLLESATGRDAGCGWDLVFHPEFLREGSSVFDFNNPPKIVVGERISGCGTKLLEIYSERFDAPRIVCPLEIAEMVKYCDNLFHALKVTFANEVGQFCHAQGIDSAKVMEIFCVDRKLNISEKYLRPGFAFGGSCLPKDLRAFLCVGKEMKVETPMLQAILESNTQQIERVVKIILETGAHSIGFWGLSFKPGTDDLRESPYVELAERLLGKGKKLLICDRNVEVSKLVGQNHSYVQQHLPHLAELIADNPNQLSRAELIIIAHPVPDELIRIWSAEGMPILDLTGGLRDINKDSLLTIV